MVLHKKKRKKKEDANDSPLFVIQRISQINQPKLNPCCIALSNQQKAQASKQTQMKNNSGVLYKEELPYPKIRRL